jgi:hypothetical protein
MVSIGSLTIRQLNLFAHKAVLALYFEHFRQPLANTGAFSPLGERRKTSPKMEFRKFYSTPIQQ